MVDSRCAIVRLVHSRRSRSNESRAAWMTRSETVSSAEVASSSSKMRGFIRIARAIAMRCFCPPDSWPAAARVLYPSGRFVMNSCAAAARAAPSTSALLTVFAMPPDMAMFSRMVRSKSWGSWFTTPKCERSHATSRRRTSTPSRSTSPRRGS
mmetsp:Transcript_52640/g.138222  ORF Transcript_52640/g.138222 Transcript_52640/m.138222 type:complete len:153 (+) Transcript_52640:2510-2968(+)